MSSDNRFSYLTHDQNKTVATGASFTASTEATGYPATNLKVQPVTKHWRSTGIASENLQIDLGSALAIDILGIINHNLTSSATITVNGGSSANPDGSQYTTTITWRQFDAFKLLTATQSWRYWKFIFADTTNPDGYIRVGFCILGDFTELAFHWQYGSSMSDRFDNIYRRTGGGAVYSEKKYNYVHYVFNFGPITQAQGSTLRTLYRDLSGSAVPIFVIPEKDVNDGYFGRFTGEFTRKLDYYEYVALDFEEDPRGRQIGA